MIDGTPAAEGPGGPVDADRGTGDDRGAGPGSAGVALVAAAESLAAEAGLDAVALGERSVERAVRARLVTTGLAPSVWAEVLRRDRVERTALIDAVVVPETMLFRDGSPFEALMALAIARSAAPVRVRLLSAACSTGEEAYSAAIALLAGGLPAAAVDIVGLDVSSAAVAVAMSGVLPRTALRGSIPAWAEPYLERRADGTVAIDPAVRARVTFRVANAISAPPDGPFDAVLCRNLLIYLTPPARTRVTDWLRAQLAPGAPLFVGHAEVGVLLDHGWRRSATYGPYALEPDPGAAPARRAGRTAATPDAPSPRPPLAAPPPPQPPATLPPQAAATPPRLADPDRLAAAVALAATGQRDAAITALTALLRDEPRDVEAYALLGVLYATAGRPDAARDALRRALYLDPDHAESRAQLALLDGSSTRPDGRP